MEQLQLLWEYQKADMTADRFEREMKQSKNRQNLIARRDFLVSQQEVMRRIEGDIVQMTERMEAIRAEVKVLEEDLRDLQETLSEEEPENIDIARKSLQHAQKLVSGINRCEQELAKIRKSAEARDRQQREVRVRAAKARAEFDSLKEAYDVEYKNDFAKLTEYRTETARAAKKLPEELLERYKQIKQHSIPPIAKLLEGNLCGGCNMNMPQVVLREIRSGAKSITCENCGRIVLVE